MRDVVPADTGVRVTDGRLRGNQEYAVHAGALNILRNVVKAGTGGRASNLVRLLIADDHPIVRDGLKRILAECPDIRVVGEATDSAEVLSKSKTSRANVLLLDISMPGPGFLEVMRRLNSERPRLRVLVLSVHAEERYAVRALQAGAAGYLNKGSSCSELVEAIRLIWRGGKYITPAIGELLALKYGPDADRAPHEALSNREYQLLCEIGSGRTVNEVATGLELSPKTVSTYRSRLLEKMQLKTNEGLICYAVRNRLVD